MTIIMCSDNGILWRRSKCLPSRINCSISRKITLKEITGIGVLSKHVNADMCVVDIGVKSDLKDTRVVNKSSLWN